MDGSGPTATVVPHPIIPSRLPLLPTRPAAIWVRSASCVSNLCIMISNCSFKVAKYLRGRWRSGLIWIDAREQLYALRLQWPWIGISWPLNTVMVQSLTYSPPSCHFGVNWPKTSKTKKNTSSIAYILWYIVIYFCIFCRYLEAKYLRSSVPWNRP